MSDIENSVPSERDKLEVLLRLLTQGCVVELQDMVIVYGTLGLLRKVVECFELRPEVQNNAWGRDLTARLRRLIDETPEIERGVISTQEESDCD